MNDIQIQYFLAVARHLNFTKAASELYITQPAISRQISALEMELGFTLFKRTTRLTSLTTAGEIFYDFFKNYDEAFKETIKRARAANEEKHGCILLGCLEGWDVSSFFPQVLNRFRTDYPNIKIMLECGSFPDVAGALSNDTFDALILIDYKLAEHRELNVLPLTRLQQIILYSADHYLSEKDNLQPTDFRDELFIVGTAENVESHIQEIYSQYGFMPKLEIVPNIPTMLSAIQNGMGVAIANTWSRERTNDSFKYLPVDYMETISIAWSKYNQNPALPLFANELVALFKQSEINQNDL